METTVTITIKHDIPFTPEDDLTILVDNLTAYATKNFPKLIKKKRKVFVKPTVQELQAQFIEKGLPKDVANTQANKFFNYFDSCGWVIGKSRKPMVSWKGAVATWVGNLSGTYSSSKSMVY